MIVLLAMVMFLVHPVCANKPAVIAMDCCNKKKESKKDGKTDDCNPFVNCCYRTFEVINNIIIKQPVTREEKPVYIQYTFTEDQGFINNCWHPPRYVVI